MSVSDYSTTASSNTDISGTNIAEGCPAGNVNNAIRQLMADVRGELTDAVLSILGKATVPEILAALGGLASTNASSSIAALTPAADRLPYYTSGSAAALATLTGFARTLLDDADASTARTTLGSIGLISYTLANPGHIRFSIPGTSGVIQVAFGRFDAAPNGPTAVVYQNPFPTTSFPVISGAAETPGAEDNNPAVVNPTTTGFTAYSAWDGTLGCQYIAVGY